LVSTLVDYYDYGHEYMGWADWKGPGWYFWEETGAHCNGPYESETKAREGMKKYARGLDRSYASASDHIRAKLELCLAMFDFSRVEKVMNCLDWHWAGCNGVPNRDEIEREAYGLLKGAYEGNTTLGCGGFQASFHEDGDSPYFVLRFVVTE